MDNHLYHGEGDTRIYMCHALALAVSLGVVDCEELHRVRDEIKAYIGDYYALRTAFHRNFGWRGSLKYCVFHNEYDYSPVYRDWANRPKINNVRPLE